MKHKAQKDPQPKAVLLRKLARGLSSQMPPQYETPISDTEGLRRAYEQGDYHIRGNTMYIASSHTMQDWYDDVTKARFWGDLRDSARYTAAEKALREHPEVTNVVGHTLGGSVALELQKGRKSLKSRTYGAPVFDPLGALP